MADPKATNRMVMALYVLLLIAGLAVLAVGLMEFAKPGGEPFLVGVGALCVIVPAALFPISIRILGAADAPSSQTGSGSDPATVELLKSINERLLVSDAAKQITHRRQDREALRTAISEDVDRGDYEAAIKLVDIMASQFGYREDAEQLRRQIEEARSAEMNRKIDSLIAELDLLIEAEDWDKAAREAEAIQRTYPDSPRVKVLTARVRTALAEYKRDMERQFLEAASRDDIDGAMALLKELDKYLTEEEAGPFRETARGVITKQRENLGVRFKMAVHDREWVQALRIGESIIREFPNTKMAEEVRGMVDLLRERANSERTARDEPATT